MSYSSRISFEQYWSTCIDILKRQVKDLSHTPSRYEEVYRMIERLHSRVEQVRSKTDHQRFSINFAHVNAVQTALLELSRLINDTPRRCREAVNAMVVLLRFMREIHLGKAINQSLRRQISELEQYEASDAKCYIDRLIPQYLPSRMPDSLTSPDARIYAIRWRGFLSRLEMRATTLRDHPSWNRHVAEVTKGLLDEVQETKFAALIQALRIGAPHEELVCIADHCNLLILIVQAQMRALLHDPQKSEWVASILIEYLNSLDLNSGNSILSWSDDDFI